MHPDWWPLHLQFIPQEHLWAANTVPVARLRTIENGDHYPGEFRSYTVLVPVADLPAAIAYPRGLAHEVSSSGPRPWAGAAPDYDPSFWVDAHNLPQDRYEPLVLAWTSKDKTVLVPDTRFLMTYGLMPRPLKDGKVTFDDPATPTFDIVQVDPPSIWDMPRRSGSEVRVVRDYLQDYLSLRGLALFEVFYANVCADVDQDSLDALAGKEAEVFPFPDREFQLNYSVDRGKASITAQVWGARLIAEPADLPITKDPIEQTGLAWPGYAAPVTPQAARHMGLNDYVYVDDAVLAPYEGKPDFSINPESGSVTFGGQWGVGFCDRIGRDTIRLELKKLYEGVPPSATRHWNRHAFLPDPGFLQTAHQARNVAIRASEIVHLWASIGHHLHRIAEKTKVPGTDAAAFVRLDQADMAYRGWWASSNVEPVARHIAIGLGRDAFLQRCLALNNLLAESLGKAPLRAILVKLGMPPDSIKGLGGLKLLNEVVCRMQVAVAVGYDIAADAGLIQAELKESGTVPARPLEYLFALYDLRVVGAHVSTDVSQEVANRLERFGVEPGEYANGFGEVLDAIYDAISVELKEIDNVLSSAVGGH